MIMDRNFYYGSDASMVSGSARFAAAINADPSAFGLTPDRCAEFVAIDATLQSAYLTAITPGTRTPVAVSAKNLAVKAMQRAAFDLTRIMLATPSVEDAQLISLGSLPRLKRTRGTAPAEA